MTCIIRNFEVNSILSLRDIGSDHLPLLISVKYHSPNTEPKGIKMYHKLDLTKCEQIVKELDTSPSIDKKDIEIKTEKLQSILKKIDNIIPRKEIKQDIGLDRPTRDLIKTRRKLKNSLRKRNNNNNTTSTIIKEKIKKISKEIKKSMKKAKEEKWIRTCKDFEDLRNPKKSWSQVKKIQGKKSKPPKIIIDKEGNIYVNKEEIANKFKERQETIFTPNKSNKQIFHELTNFWYDSQSFSQKDFPYITQDEVLNKINKLKMHKAPGIFGTTNKLIKSLKPLLLKPLTNLFNDYLRLSHFPSSYKIAKLIMIPKKPNTNKLEEFRPISLLPTLSKLFESILASRIYKWAEENDKINEEQSGFRTNRSTQDNIFQFLQSIMERKNRNQSISAIFIDFEKAFDKVNHKYLLYKLNTLKLPKYLINIVKSFLTNRKCFVNFNLFDSTTFNIKAGVPQGSCLSPILFSLFVSDIPKDSLCKLSQFADDLATWAINTQKGKKKLQTFLNILNEWCMKWGLCLNIYKTKNMNLGKNKTSFSLNNIKLENVDEIKFLGITLDKNLNFNKHFTKVRNECIPRITLLRTLKERYLISNSRLRQLYKSLVRSKLEYSFLPLLVTNESNINKMEVVQNMSLRIISNKTTRYRNTLLRAENNIISIKERAKVLGKNWFAKISNDNKHPITKNKHEYKYLPEYDKIKPLYNILKDL